MLRGGPARTGAPESTSLLPAERLCSQRFRTNEEDRLNSIPAARMCGRGRAPGSRQDITSAERGLWSRISTSSTTFRSSTCRGALFSYDSCSRLRWPLRPTMGYLHEQDPLLISNTNNYVVSASHPGGFGRARGHLQLRKFNPFLEGGPGADFLPSATPAQLRWMQSSRPNLAACTEAVSLRDPAQFDIPRVRGFFTKVPTFGDKEFTTTSGQHSTTPHWRGPITF